jgi:CubicO group peptidase (beta-lactamase class C family)
VGRPVLDDDGERLCAGLLDAGGVPGAALGVLFDGEQWVRGFGVLERGRPEHVAAATTFRVASITKPFTAALALALVREGRLALEGALPSRADVTVRQALAHLGGFESECGDLARFGESDDALAALAEELAGQRQVVPPGELWSYCNAGYWLVGHLLAQRARTSYEEALAGRVLRPLALAATGFGEPEAAAHDPEPRRPHYPRARRASGGLTSNVPDLLRFAGFLLGDEAAAQRVPAAATPGGAYGLGLMLDEQVPGLRLWGHTGSWGGYESRLFVEPDRRFAFVGLANAEGAAPVLRQLQDELVERLLGPSRETAPAVALPAAELALLAGRYASAEVDLRLTVREGGLWLNPLSPAVEVEPGPARPLGGRLFEIATGRSRGSRFDFHPERGEPRFVRYASRLAERVS